MRSNPTSTGCEAALDWPSLKMSTEDLIARSISDCKVTARNGRNWQYHSRSDRHSKIACWAVLFDLLRSCPLLRQHAATGKVFFGINHEMRDFRLNRKKNLDLVLCSGKPSEKGCPSFFEYGREIGIVLTAHEKAELAKLPALAAGSVATVLVALEAKACMTAHVKARPRLYDELASSFQTIHGDTASALAAAFVMINTAAEFVSPGLNTGRGKPTVNQHRQPDDALAVLAKVMELPRRSDERGVGFDAIGVTMVSCRNDGSPIIPDPSVGEKVDQIARYDALIQRLSHLYAARFSAL